MHKAMNYKNILLSTLALIPFFSACNLADGIGDDVQNTIGGKDANVAYMSSIQGSQAVGVLASDEGFTQVVTPRLAAPAAEDIKVTVTVDAAALEAYNKVNNLALLPIKPEDLILTNSDGVEGKGQVEATIKKGALSTPVIVKMTSINPEKYPYSAKLAAPISIASASNGVKVLSDPKSAFITLNRKIVTSVLHVERSNGNGYTMQFAPVEDYKSPNEWTFQYIVQVQNIHGNNQTLGSLGGGHGFYNRVSKTGGLQCKSEGRDGNDTWTNKPVNEKEWLHVSYVYRQNGLAGNLSFYVNGVLQKTFTTSSMMIEKNAGWGFGNSMVSDYYLREVRFWNRALSEAEIRDRYYLPETKDAPGLVACFPLTRESYDEETKAFKDIMGNWKWSITSSKGADWEFTDHVVFPAKALTIEAPEKAAPEKADKE